MGAYEDAVKALKHFGGPGGFDDEIDYAFRHRLVSVHVNLLTASTAYRVPLCTADKAMTIVSAGFITDAGAVSDATNYRNAKLQKHTAASATATLFDTKGGASTAITADLPTAFTIVESTDTLAATEVLEVLFDVAGTGDAWLGTTVYAVLRLD